MGIKFIRDGEDILATPPSHEELQREKMALEAENAKLKMASYHYDGGQPPTNTKHTKRYNSDWDKTMTPDTTKMVWSIINENTQLQQENYMLKNQLEQIRRLLAE
jgi:hypothetical protein